VPPQETWHSSSSTPDHYEDSRTSPPDRLHRLLRIEEEDAAEDQDASEGQEGAQDEVFFSREMIEI
jgi:hypothetical protein